MKLFTIFGNPIHHSKSPRMYNKCFAFYSKNDYCYTRTLLENGQDIINVFRRLKLQGASVTLPHKEWAYKLADEVRGIAKEIKAVNCLVLEGDKVIGYNTDALGFVESIKEFQYESVLIIGAGGTAKALSLMFKNADILNRSANRLQNFTHNTFTWETFQPRKYDLIINTTSAGLDNDNLPAPQEILEQLFQKAKYAVDVIYKTTPFLKLAKQYNLQTKDGSDMLVYQGVLQFEKFVDFKINKQEVAKLMKGVL
ncbi:MAG: shikimate dehydrogenase [Epsilonproteobacteria bacterium]|nr:shikimate dehydrogenase [Campylobacterota bacterium]